MLDWQEITRHIQNGETLSVEDLMAELSALRDKNPDVGKEVSAYFSRKNRLKNFMLTSASGKRTRDEILPNGTVLGVWRLTDHIGSGGMGDVYKAERSDGLYDQVVALKVIQRRDDDSLHRFEEERKRLANLEHPGISRIIDGGATDTGQPFMVMEYLEGESIDEFISAKSLNRPEILGLFKNLCASITHAHSNLILHRDIKTSNVLVDRSGNAKLIDFGIASVMGDTSETYGGPMTIAYASPEQLLRKVPSVGGDIFALGVLVHKLLTGETPQRNSNGGVEVDSQAIKDDDLSAIVSKATAFNEKDRYQSVTALSDDITAFLQTRPVGARNGSGTYRFWKYVKRNSAASALAAAFIIALLGGVITSLAMANKATKEARRANEELTRAEWLAKESNHNASLGFSTKDAFQYAFSQEADKERFNERLIEYLAEIPEKDSEIMPEVVAAKKFAVASHFLSGNDYVTARKILEPWVTKGLGGDHMLSLGRGALGYTYLDAGEKKLAGEMFSKAAAYYEGTPGVERMDYTNMLIQSALMLGDSEGAEKARNAIEDRLKIEDNKFYRMYLTAQLYKVERQQKNWQAAHEAQLDVIEMLDEGSNDSTAGTDTVRLNLADMHVYYTQEYPLALVQIEKAQQIADERKGKSKSLGRIHELRAILAWVEGDNQSALEYISKSLVIYDKYTGKKGNYTKALGQKGIFQTDNGDFSAALETLIELRSEDLANTAGQWPDLLELYMIAKKSNIAEAQAHYDNPEFDREEMNGNLPQIYYLKVLEEIGLKL